MHHILAGTSRDWKEPSAACVGLVTAAFWVFTYVLLTFWARALVEEPFPLLSLRRAMAVSTGAFIYWIVLRRIVDGGEQLNPLKILAAILPAGLAVLAMRAVFDALFFEAPLPQSANIRWVLVWTGYFGLWVSGALAFRMQDGFFRAAPAPASVIEQVQAPPVAMARPVTNRESRAELTADWEWVVKAIADELETLPESNRAAVADRIMSRGGYHLAESDDPETIAHNRRADLVHCIVGRLAARAD